MSTSYEAFVHEITDGLRGWVRSEFPSQADEILEATEAYLKQSEEIRDWFVKLDKGDLSFSRFKALARDRDSWLSPDVLQAHALHVDEIDAVSEKIALTLVSTARSYSEPRMLKGGSAPRESSTRRKKKASSKRKSRRRGSDAGARGPDGGGSSAHAPPRRWKLSPREPAAAGPRKEADLLLSTQGPRRLLAGRKDDIKVRIERDDALADPLATAISATVGAEVPITVYASVIGDALKLVNGPQACDVQVPGSGAPVDLSFEICGVRPGRARVQIDFHQGSADLGTLLLVTEVTETEADRDPQSINARAATRSDADSDVTLLFIQEDRQESGATVLKYYLTSDALKLNRVAFLSPELQASSTAPTVLAFAESIYASLIDDKLSSASDHARFHLKLDGIAKRLAEAVIPKDLLHTLWKNRESIHAMHITSNDPHIPWELLKLHDPDKPGKLDERYLAEYRLTRSLQGWKAPNRLRARQWSYVAADYPFETHPSVANSVEFLGEAASAHGLPAPRAIEPDVLKIVEAMQPPEFDVLHVAAHGKTDPEKIDSAALFIGDEQTRRGVRPIELNRDHLSGVNLESRTPIVFLNACESAKMGRGLADAGGWPRTFWDLHVGAFVGALWPVRDEPATTFARAFYRSLLDGELLRDAVQSAREAAKQHKDPSWLAYAVYGEANARVKGD